MSCRFLAKKAGANQGEFSSLTPLCHRPSRVVSSLRGTIVFHQSENISLGTARFTDDVIHQTPNQKHAPPADAQFRRVEMWHAGHIKSFAFVEQPNFQPVYEWYDLNFKNRIGAADMGMANDILEGFMGRELNRAAETLVAAQLAANRFDKRTSQSQQMKITGKRERKRRVIGGHRQISGRSDRSRWMEEANADSSCNE